MQHVVSRNRLWILPLLWCCIVVAGCDSAGGVAPGQRIPKFSLTTLKGREIRSEDLKGKATVVSFWASWCEPCIKELPSLERLHQRLQGMGGQVVSIGIDDSKANLQAVVDAHGVTFPVLIDDDGVAKRRFKVLGVPETFLVSKQGTIVPLLSDGGKVEVRLTGAREWDTDATVALLAGALGL